MKTNTDGSLDRYKARCAIGVDRMVPRDHFDPTHIFGTTPSYAARRVSIAEAAAEAEGHAIKTWDDPRAYP